MEKSVKVDKSPFSTIHESVKFMPQGTLFLIWQIEYPRVKIEKIEKVRNSVEKDVREVMTVAKVLKEEQVKEERKESPKHLILNFK